MPVPKPDSFVLLFLSVLQQSEVQYVARHLLSFSTALNSPVGTSKLKIVMAINRRRKVKLESETYPQWEEKRKMTPDLRHETQEFELYFIDKNGNLNKRKR